MDLFEPIKLLPASRRGRTAAAAVDTGSTTRLIRSAAVLTTAAATIALSASGALFTDSDDVTANAIDTGTIALTTSGATIDFALTAMAPGDSSTVQQLTVTNGGDLELRYSLVSDTDEDTLAAELDLDVWDEADETVADGTCSDALAPSGGYLYQGPLGSTAGTAIFGDATAGADGGDQTLAGAAADVLCFDVALPIGSGNTFQNLSSTATLTFSSEQTANNT